MRGPVLNTYGTVADFIMEFLFIGVGIQIVMHFVGVATGAPVRWIEHQFSRGSKEA